MDSNTNNAYEINYLLKKQMLPFIDQHLAVVFYDLKTNLIR